MKELEKWTDEELIQVYDLQEKYAEKVVDFVRHEEESEVLKFMNLISAMHSCDDFKIFDKEIYRKNEFVAEMSGEKIPQGRFVYKDLFEKWKGADSLRLKKYSIEKLRNALPEKLKEKIKNLIMNYPKEIEEKAIQTRIYGYTSAISNYALLRYRNEHMPEFEKLQFIVQQEKMNTIVAAYDLQAGLKIYQSNLDGRDLTEVIRNFASDKKIFEIVYGEKLFKVFMNTEEKLKIYNKAGFSEVSYRDFEIILDKFSKNIIRARAVTKIIPNKVIKLSAE